MTTSPAPSGAPGSSAARAGLLGVDALRGGWAPALLELLGELSDVMFCAKDAEGRYVVVNDAFVRRTRERSRRAVVGRRAGELFVAALAERYEEQDSQVLGTGRALRRELELIRREGGHPGWYLSTKLPVLADDGSSRVVGLVSLSEEVRATGADDSDVRDFGRVLELVRDGVDRPLRPADLAREVGWSLAVLERRTRRIVGLSPTQLVLRARIDHASALLTTTDAPLAEVAAACGFYDQPAFTRQFARLSGETPGQFRRRGGAPT